MCGSGFSTERLPRPDSRGETPLVDIPSEMIPQPCKADDSAAMIIKALSRHSKMATLDESDFGNRGCTATARSAMNVPQHAHVTAAAKTHKRAGYRTLVDRRTVRLTCVGTAAYENVPLGI